MRFEKIFIRRRLLTLFSPLVYIICSRMFVRILEINFILLSLKFCICFDVRINIVQNS